MEKILDKVIFNEDGLIPVIAQQYDSGEVLMLAWMNREALEKTIKTGHMNYWSRSRGALWRKGETSGQNQHLKELIFDCDFDTILALVDQEGVACHTGRRNCFFNSLSGGKIKINRHQSISPGKLYNKP